MLVEFASGDHTAVYGDIRGDITVAVHDNIVTGVYQYYDKWNEQYQEYTDINVFYIYGHCQGGSCDITTRESAGEKVIKGRLFFLENSRKLKMVLEEMHNGYATIDFTKDTPGNIFPMQQQLTATEIRVVKTPKAFLYNHTPAGYVLRKGYLVKENVVRVTAEMEGFVAVTYKSPATGKTINYVIKKGDLYPIDPEIWDK